MPIPLILLILGAIAAITITVVVVAILYWNDIKNWFQSRNYLKQSDKDNIAFTIQEKLSSGNYKTVQGIFNQRTNDIKDGRVIESKDIDSGVRNAHRNDQVVIYE